MRRPLLFTLFFILLATIPAMAVAEIPRAAHQYHHLLVRIAHQQMGLDAPLATLAAQVHQESRWNSDATSRVGAGGLAQFMPATAQWIPDIAPALGEPQPYNPGWALRAMITFDAWLLDRTQPAATQCENWAFTLSAYNGGLGWVRRDRTAASVSGIDQRVWFDSVERINAGRSATALAENRHYVRAILTRHEKLYATAGWGRGVCDQRWAT